MSNTWYKLDNSAKIIPSMTNSLNTNVFRLVCTLKEEVFPEILTLALNETLEEFPIFTCSMKMGLFWHYLEPSNKSILVEEECTNPCSKIQGSHLFRLSYYKNRINLEVYHVLSDGNGAMEFLKYLVTTYINIAHKIDDKIVLSTASKYEKLQDDFSKFDSAKKKLKFSKAKKAYKLKYPRKDNLIPDIIEAHMSAKKVHELAKKHDTTVTIYLTAILIKSIQENAKIKDLKRPIGITIPVDLRHIFPSKTARNFFYTQSIQYKSVPDATLDDIIKSLKEDFKNTFSKENLQELLDSYMVLEDILLIRIIPTLLKDFILGLITGSKSTETMTLSNLGVIKLPSIYDKYIECFSGYMSTEDLHLTVMTYKDEITLGFTSHFITKEIERTMLMFLEGEGVEKIKIISNMRGDEDDKM